MRFQTCESLLAISRSVERKSHVVMLVPTSPQILARQPVKPVSISNTLLPSGERFRQAGPNWPDLQLPWAYYAWSCTAAINVTPQTRASSAAAAGAHQETWQWQRGTQSTARSLALGQLVQWYCMRCTVLYVTAADRGPLND